VTEVTGDDEPARTLTGMGELDRVLGGGLVAGSVVLLGGDPGIGKSTLLLQAADALARNQRVLYASGEESVRQVALRATRLGATSDALRLVAETRVESIMGEAVAAHARVLVVDSIQTMHSEASESSPGSAVQVRECAARLVRFAKDSGTAVLIIGHVTKEGQIAGPRILEHMVDTVSGSCEPSRTASARATRLAFSPWRSRACGRSAILPPFFCPVTRSRCRGAWSPWRGRAAGRCWSKCRRWSTRPRA